MIPESIKIGAKTLQVRVQHYLSDDGELGNCLPNQGLIRIENLQPEDEKEETLLHEILHCCCSFAGIQDDEKLTEEELISRISPILYTVLKENKLPFTKPE
jgi:hypothetical protein